MKGLPLIALLVATTVGGCSQGAADEAKLAPVTTEAASKAFDSASQAWTSMNAAKIDAIYADNVVAFDPGYPATINGLGALAPQNAKFAKLAFDGMRMTDRDIVPLGPTMFMATGVSHLTSSADAAKSMDVRFTEIFSRQPDGSWKIIHEHLSDVPEGAINTPPALPPG